MSSAGRAASSSGCVARPKEHATGLIGFAVQIRRSSLIGSCVMEAAEHREPCESRGSRTDLGAPGGEIPPGDSTKADKPSRAKIHRCPLLSKSGQTIAGQNPPLSAIVKKRTNHRGPKSTVVRYCPKADKFCSAAK